MKIYLIGHFGQLGSVLGQKLTSQYEVIGTHRMIVGDSIPNVDLIINASAYTHVDRAEVERGSCHAVNVELPKYLAQKAREMDIPLIHFCTNYVFDGNRHGCPYVETDRCLPLSHYGKTKLEGTLVVGNEHSKYLVFRLSGIYGGVRSFVKTMTDAYHKRAEVIVVNDQAITPNDVSPVSEVVVNIIHQMTLPGFNKWGTYHLSGEGETSWHNFACSIYEKLNMMNKTQVPAPKPISSEDYSKKYSGTIAARPRYAVLDSSKLARTFGLTLGSWEEQFEEFWENEYCPSKSNPSSMNTINH